MSEGTFTFTARSAQNPDQMATFTLQGDTVTVQLGNAILERVEHAFDSVQGEAPNRFTNWIEPAATGALQKVMQPISLVDFDANMSGDALNIVAWIRVGGLRLAPIVVTWKQVDNPAGAEAFVAEIQQRRKTVLEEGKVPDVTDYWATWILLGIITTILPLLWWRMLQNRRSG